jgi:hypothetical protein
LIGFQIPSDRTLHGLNPEIANTKTQTQAFRQAAAASKQKKD